MTLGSWEQYNGILYMCYIHRLHFEWNVIWFLIIWENSKCGYQPQWFDCFLQNKHVKCDVHCTQYVLCTVPMLFHMTPCQTPLICLFSTHFIILSLKLLHFVRRWTNLEPLWVRCWPFFPIDLINIFSLCRSWFIDLLHRNQ